jgi:hypothetical protein
MYMFRPPFVAILREVLYKAYITKTSKTNTSCTHIFLSFQDCDTIHNSAWNTHYSLKFSTNNFICIWYFNIFFKPYILKLNILYLCTGFWCFCNIYLYNISLRMAIKGGWNMYMQEVYHVYNVIYSCVFICICWFYLQIKSPTHLYGLFKVTHTFIRVLCGRQVIIEWNFLHLVRCDVLINIRVFLNVMPCNLVEQHQCFTETFASIRIEGEGSRLIYNGTLLE